MNILCRNSLINLRCIGTRNEKKICDYLLQDGLPKKTFAKLIDFSNFFNISNASVTRFIKKLGYPTFKHFIYELNSSKKAKYINLEKSLIRKEETFRKNLDILKEKYRKGKYLFISSKRGKAITKFANAELGVIGAETKYFHKDKDNIKKFIGSSTKNDTIILLTLTGWSNIVSKAIEEISKLQEKPQIFIFTISKWTTVFDKYNYINFITLNEKRQTELNFKQYNLISLKFIEIFILWSNQLHSIKNVN